MPIAAVLHSFAYSLDYLREQVATLSPAQMVTPTQAVRNHPAWTIGHLTLTCQMIGATIGVEPWLPEDWMARFGTGSVPGSDLAQYPSKPHALAMLKEAQDRITTAVRRLDAAALDAAFPDPSYHEVFPTIFHALTQVLVAHTAYHVAQLALWRKAMALPPMKRSFE